MSSSHIDDPDEGMLPQILNFITGCSSIPLLGFKQELQVKYRGSCLAEACLKPFRANITSSVEAWINAHFQMQVILYGVVARFIGGRSHS